MHRQKVRLQVWRLLLRPQRVALLPNLMILYLVPITVNGGLVTVDHGTWGLVRASSNKPELVVVVESPVSEARMRDMFKAVDAVLRTHPDVGEYNQTI